MDYFFYGTLMDADVLARVAGRRVAASNVEPAVVSGYRRVYVAGAPYPMLVPAPEGRVEGRLVSGLGGLETRRVAWFEGAEYELRPVRVRAARRGELEALAFMAGPGLGPSAEDWDLAAWRRRHKRAYLMRVAGWMAPYAKAVRV